MIKFLALTTIVFTLGILAVTFDDAFATPCTTDDNCNWKNVKSTFDLQ